MSSTRSNPDRARYQQLIESINEHDYLYYVLDQPKISDREYDRLYRELIDIEAKNPELREPSSPTQRVGGAPLDAFAKILRKDKMMSLDNTYNETELRDFHRRVVEGLGTEAVEFTVEPKIDGLGIECVYKNGRFVQGSTRGDGLVGEDITLNLRTIRSIPLVLRSAEGLAPASVTVRGEVYLERGDLEQINEERARDGLPPFKNPRNAAAGSVRLLDSNVTARRPLRSLFYHYLEGRNLDLTYEESMAKLKGWGVSVNVGMSVVSNVGQILTACTDWREKRLALPYDVDGLVIKVNRYDHQRSLGETSKFPRWSIAFKYEAEQAETTVLNIRIQVGRTGVLTPVADLEPVQLAGSTVSRASLHNAEEVERKDVRINDVAVVEKAGEIIPQVVKVFPERRTGKPRKFSMPRACPACKGPVGKIDESDVAIRCLNGLSCPAQLKESIRYFASRRAMNIEGLGPALVDQFIATNLVHDVADLFSLDEGRIANLDRLGEKSACNLIEAIERARKSATLPRLLTGLGIPLVGEVAASDLAEHGGRIDYFIESKREKLVEELTTVDGIGPRMASAIAVFFRLKQNRDVLAKLQAAGVNPIHKKMPRSGRLADKLFCITGTLSKPRDEVKADILRAGGKWNPTVTKKTDYLVAGGNTGATKLADAQKKQVNVITEKELYVLIG